MDNRNEAKRAPMVENGNADEHRVFEAPTISTNLHCSVLPTRPGDQAAVSTSSTPIRSPIASQPSDTSVSPFPRALNTSGPSFWRTISRLVLRILEKPDWAELDQSDSQCTLEQLGDTAERGKIGNLECSPNHMEGTAAVNARAMEMSEVPVKIGVLEETRRSEDLDKGSTSESRRTPALKRTSNAIASGLHIFRSTLKTPNFNIPFARKDYVGYQTMLRNLEDAGYEDTLPTAYEPKQVADTIKRNRITLAALMSVSLTRSPETSGEPHSEGTVSGRTNEGDERCDPIPPELDKNSGEVEDQVIGDLTLPGPEINDSTSENRVPESINQLPKGENVDLENGLEPQSEKDDGAPPSDSSDEEDKLSFGVKETVVKVDTFVEPPGEKTGAPIPGDLASPSSDRPDREEFRNHVPPEALNVGEIIDLDFRDGNLVLIRHPGNRALGTYNPDEAEFCLGCRSIVPWQHHCPLRAQRSPTYTPPNERRDRAW